MNALAGSRLFSRRINRAPSRLLAVATPWLSIVGGSLVPLSPIIASAPVVPPVGFMLLIGWRLLRPGLLPVWAGLPLGLVDDLFSGQPFGSGIFLWSLAMLAIERADNWLRWRGFWQDWLVAALLIVVYLLLCLAIVNLTGGAAGITLLLPQMVLAVLSYPIIARAIAVLDTLRLARVRVIG